jgi:hypothetical protein
MLVRCRLLVQAGHRDGVSEESDCEEEGEVANNGAAPPSVTMLRRLLREALSLHPAAVLGRCVSVLAAASSRSAPKPDPHVLQGLRTWLRDHLLRDRTPSRETTPVGGDGSGSAPAGSFLAQRSSCLGRILGSSHEAQSWVMHQAKGRASGTDGHLHTHLNRQGGHARRPALTLR